MRAPIYQSELNMILEIGFSYLSGYKVIPDTIVLQYMQVQVTGSINLHRILSIARTMQALFLLAQRHQSRLLCMLTDLRKQIAWV